jgi:hypothetical protein
LKKIETLNPGACILKYFMAVINSAQQNVTVSHFRPSLIFGARLEPTLVVGTPILDKAL